MASTDSSSCLQHPQLPPGFRFHPTDEELIVHYLRNKTSSVPLPVTNSIIAEIDLYKFDPWELPDKAAFGEQEWYFFSPRDRKYPNGARPNRAATSGYWKATGTDKAIYRDGGTRLVVQIGVKKALVFYRGKPPKGIKTNWIMHEYRLFEKIGNSGNNLSVQSVEKRTSLRLDEWVLCRIYKKHESLKPVSDREKEDSMEGMLSSVPNSNLNPLGSKRTSNYGGLLENNENIFDDLLSGDGVHNNPISELASFTSSVTAGTESFYRPLPPPYWHDPGTIGQTPGISRYHVPQQDIVGRGRGGGAGEGSSSMPNIFNQFPHQVQFHQQNLIGSLDAVYRSQLQMSGLNWSSH
ncbi:hypothetical protein GIB67_028405 [Kingdonia uniflora]|uniref:NAC domain-containing protein n=1 Tax=Kingdonia uniflora TaxID=39325 RepID=A0A7J7MHY1_9MAGN|nr:hypothetical protein GIB67_028405 [Kingdonia uniflora]